MIVMQMGEPLPQSQGVCNLEQAAFKDLYLVAFILSSILTSVAVIVSEAHVRFKQLN